MAMAIEEYVRKRGRATQVKQVREKINQLGIDYIYYQFISVTGRIVGKGVPADHWETIAEKGFQLVYGSVANLYVDRYGQYIGYGPESSELVGIPDPETFVQLPWDKRVARVYVTCFRNREEKQDPGGFFTGDCRGNLRRIHDEFQKKHKGMHLQARHRAGDDVAEEGRGRPAQRRFLQAELLPHRPVRKPAPGIHEGHRVQPRHGPGHDPGRP